MSGTSKPAASAKRPRISGKVGGVREPLHRYIGDTPQRFVWTDRIERGHAVVREDRDLGVARPHLRSATFEWEAARQFQERYSQLRVLVNNAGAHIRQRKLSIDGIEMSLTVNHLSAFLLTRLLLDALRASAPARIVNVASRAMADARPVTFVGKPRPATIDFDDLQSEREFVPFEVYGRAKLAMLLCTYALAWRLAGTGVTANALHPGITATNIINNVASPLARPFLGLIKPFLPIPERGARTAFYLATSPAVEGVSGRYFIREKEASSVPISYGEALQERTSEQLTGLAG